MRSRVDLDKFQEGAMATGVGLHWHEWRFSVEVGGKLYTKLVESGDITSHQHNHLKNFILDSQKNKDVVKKEKVVENVGDADKKVLYNNWQVSQRLWVRFLLLPRARRVILWI